MKYVRAKQIAEEKGVCIATVWRWAAAGILPAPIRPTKRTTLWNAEEVDEALAKLGETS